MLGAAAQHPFMPISLVLATPPPHPLTVVVVPLVHFTKTQSSTPVVGDVTSVSTLQKVLSASVSL